MNPWLLLHDPMRAWLCAACCALVAASAQARCERMVVTVPERGHAVMDLQPELRWAGQSSARYRVQLAVVVPEGRVLDSVDTWVMGTRWRLPAPVTVPNAAVKLIVSRDCPAYSVQDLNAEPAHFSVRTRAHCPSVGTTLRQEGPLLQWQAAAQATGFVLRLHVVNPDADTGATVALLQSSESKEPVWTMPANWQPVLSDKALVAEVRVVSVQALCGSLTSAVQSVVLDAWP